MAKSSKVQTVLFIGDSITDCGRRGGAAPLGDGYVRHVADMLAIREPQRDIHIINKGISGQTVVELQERWTDDVIEQHPDVLSMMVGINDVCRAVAQSPAVVPPGRYEACYDEVMSRTARELPSCRVILLEPFYITRDAASASIRHLILAKLPDYIGVVHRMARKYGAVLIQTQKEYQRLLRYHKPEAFCEEPVHPNRRGHLVIAEAVYRELEPLTRHAAKRPLRF